MVNNLSTQEAGMAEQVTPIGTVVRNHQIIGTNFRVYTAWEALDGHSTQTHDDTYGWLGRVGTRRLPAHLDALPAYSDERIAAVTAWHAAQYQEAYDAILDLYPQAAAGKRSMGEIMVVVEG